MTTHENSTFDRLLHFRAAMKQLGALLDGDAISEQEYQDTEARYASLFDQRCDLEDALLAEPISCDADIDAKISVLAQRSRLAYDMAAHVQRLERQIAEYRNG